MAAVGALSLPVLFVVCFTFYLTFDHDVIMII